MHGATFITAVIPAPLIVLAYSTSILKSLKPESDSIRCYLKTFIAFELSIMLMRVALTIRRATIGYSLSRGRLPETPNPNPIDKFLIPILEELIKIPLLALCVCFASSPEYLWSHVLLAACVCALNKLVCNYLTFNPSNYDKKFKKFLRLHRKYREHLLCRFPKKSVSSFHSDCTQSSQPIPSSLDIPEREKPQFNSVSYDIPRVEVSPIEIAPNGIMAHHDVIDRLYSVSPKDTLHLVYVEDLHKQDEHSSLLADCTNTYETFRPVHAPTIKSEINVADVSLSSEDADSTLESTERTQTWKHIILWFSWIYPVENSRPPETQVSKSATIRKKLSTYTFNSDNSSAKSIKTRKSIDTFDFENQSYLQPKKVANNHTFRDFAAYANKYLDFWSPNLAGIMRLIDPAFMNFGVTIKEMSSVFFTMHLLNICLWQYVSVLILAFPLISQAVPYSIYTVSIPSIAIFKLFVKNYLNSQCTLSYKCSILIELLMNIAIAISTGILYATYIFT